MEEKFTEQLPKPKNQFLIDVGQMLIIFVVYNLILFFIVPLVIPRFKPSENHNAEYTISSDNIVDVNDPDAITSFLLSKKFKNDNMSIRFEPGGYYELKKDYEVVLTGTWRIGEKKYDRSIILYLSSQSGNLIFLLSNDGKIMDKSSLRIFK